jgi:putative redox protein
MIHSVKTIWKEGMAFDNQIDNHTIRIDTNRETGNDTGPGPKKLLLASLAGCSGMDVVFLLNKMRVPFSHFEMDIDADLTNEHPKVYSEIRLIYRVHTSKTYEKKIKKAVDLSQDKYCGVSAMLAKNCPIVYTIDIIE